MPPGLDDIGARYDAHDLAIGTRTRISRRKQRETAETAQAMLAPALEGATARHAETPDQRLALCRSLDERLVVLAEAGLLIAGSGPRLETSPGAVADLSQGEVLDALDWVRGDR